MAAQAMGLGQLRAFVSNLLSPVWQPRGQHSSWGFFNFLDIFPSLAHRLRHTLQSIVGNLIDSVMAFRRDSAVALPPDFHMVHLKTKEECRLGDETIQVWTVELPSKHAEGILRVIKETIPGQENVDLQHLRRFAKPKFLPEHVLNKPNVLKDINTPPSTSSSALQSSASTEWEWTTPSRPRSASRPQTLHLLICPTRCVDAKSLQEILLQHPPFCSSPESWAFPLEMKEITVPLLAPTSPEKAAAWTAAYWPTFYRKTNPFGAHPSAITKAEEELECPIEDDLSVEEALALAEQVGTDARQQGLGVGTGCVIMERVDGRSQVVAVAGDARFRPQANAVSIDSPGPCQGNIMGHVVMRAVGMIGRKRLRCASQAVTKAAAKAESNFNKGGLEHDVKARDAFFLDLPVMPLEAKYFQLDNLKPDGYLCLKLEIFLTHEPCMMCSMALVHSRVGRVIFQHRMPKTGGLTAEKVSNSSGPVGLGYGLCWRKELNWQFMCWEYIAKEQAGTVTRTLPRGRDRRRKDSTHTEKYQPEDAAPEDATVDADVTSRSSFASIHV